MCFVYYYANSSRARDCSDTEVMLSREHMLSESDRSRYIVNTLSRTSQGPPNKDPVRSPKASRAHRGHVLISDTLSRTKRVQERDNTLINVMVATIWFID